MPFIEDWMTRPHSVVQKLFEENKGNSHENFIKQVQTYFNQRVNDESILKIPSLNSMNTDQLVSGSLVRYRCMVQDVFDPQFCFAQYTVRNNKTNVTRIKCGTFRDISNVAPDETVDTDSRDNVPVERQGFYCVPIPGETAWVKEIYSKAYTQRSMSPSKMGGEAKRTREGEEEEIVPDQKTIKSDVNSLITPEVLSEHSNLPESSCSTTSQGNSKSKSTSIDMNHPLPDETGTPCIVRVYSNEVELKMSAGVEFIGILSLDPELASIHDDQTEGDDQDELCAHEPPASLVPRLHAILVRPMDHNNPILPPLTSSDTFKIGVRDMMNDICSLRMDILSILEHVLMGDQLAAEYLLCHIVSRVYARADVLPLGKFCLNLSGCPNYQRYAKFLHHMIYQLSTKSTLMEMSIENLNSWKLIPKKDYNLNRVTAGMLQLSSGTHLVLDETALQQGQLNSLGVFNVKALEEVITWQKVDYDFQWSVIPIHTDVNVLIISEGTSFLSKDFHVPVVRENIIEDIPAHFAKLDSRLTDANLQKLRSYITVCRLREYEVSEDMQKLMQDDFVETRQDDPNEMTVEDFKKLLTLVRLLTISCGKDRPTQEVWTKAKTMELERKARIARLPQPSNGTR